VFGDLRLYQPVGWGGLKLRAVGGTVVGDNPLPVQRRFSLGGPDPMPGYDFRRFACNGTLADPAFPALCDHMMLFQAEYRGGLNVDPFDGMWERDEAGRRPRSRDWGDWDGDWFNEPQFVLFADAGSAWLEGATPDPLKWDVGAGLELGSVGLYAARAIERELRARWSHSESPSADLLLKRVDQAIHARDSDTARQIAQKLTEIAPEFAEGWHRRATLAAEKDDFQDAIDSLQRVLTLQPKHFIALAELGQILEEFDDKGRALDAYRRAKEIDPFIEGLEDRIRQLSKEVEGQGI
jgi:hypothetical protein